MDTIVLDDNERIEDLLLSASSLKTFEQCGRKFYLSKIKKAEPTHTDARIYGWIGTIVHNSIYFSIADFKKDTWVVSEEKTLDQVRGFFDGLWEGSDISFVRALQGRGEVPLEKPDFSAYLVNDKKIASMSDLSDEDKWKKLAWNLVVNGYNLTTKVITKVDGIENIYIEEPLNFKKYGVSFIGYIDILLSLKNTFVFFDFKTSRKAITKPDEDLQFYLYRVGLREQFGLNHYPLGYYTHLRSSRIYPANTNDQTFFKRMDERVEGIISRIYSSEFYPSLGSPLCKYCEYRGYCYVDDSMISPDLSHIIDSMTVKERVEYDEDALLVE